MQAENFDDLVTNSVMSGFKNRMLYVFIRIGAMDAETKRDILGDDAVDEDAGFVQILLDAHQPAVHGLTFEAQNFLKNMRDRILAGDVGDFAILDRTGTPVAVETDVVPGAGETIN